MTRISTDIALRNDWLLRRLFGFAALGLPLAAVGETRRPVMTPDPVVEREPQRALRRSAGSSAT